MFQRLEHRVRLSHADAVAVQKSLQVTDSTDRGDKVSVTQPEPCSNDDQAVEESIAEPKCITDCQADAFPDAGRHKITYGATDTVGPSHNSQRGLAHCAWRRIALGGACVRRCRVAHLLQRGESARVMDAAFALRVVACLLVITSVVTFVLVFKARRFRRFLASNNVAFVMMCLAGILFKIANKLQVNAAH